MKRKAIVLVLSLLGCGQVENSQVEETSDELVRHRFFAIRTVDQDGRAVSGVTLTTTNAIQYLSDRNGMVAFYEPGLMNVPVYFGVEKGGYDPPLTTFFEFRGETLTPREGESATIVVTRNQDAEGPANKFDDDTNLLRGDVPSRARCFLFEVKDQSSKRGVPMVELTNDDGRHFYTDSAGRSAMCLPSLLGRRTRFTLRSNGYSTRSEWVSARANGSTTIYLTRVNIAERLYRFSGQGIYRDSVLVGANTPPVNNPVENRQVMGLDSVQTAIYQGKLFWIWGDTVWTRNPLGNFHTTGATSLLPGKGGLDPENGVNLTYFTDDQSDGFVKGISPHPEAGVVWTSYPVVTKNSAGREVLIADYGRFGQDFELFESGRMIWNDATNEFVRAYVDGVQGPAFPKAGFPQHLGEFVYYGGSVRVADRVESVLNRDAYEIYTPVIVDGDDSVDRDENGVIRYAWRQGSRPVTLQDIADGKVAADELLEGQIRDVVTGTPLWTSTPGNIFWNQYRQRYTLITGALGAMPSVLGEIYYAEADTPMGPWIYAKKIVTHDLDLMSFYNPMQHPYFHKQDGKILYFEATYTPGLSGLTVLGMPRYNYNQIMYKLDLGDVRLAMPVAFYSVGPGTLRQKTQLQGDEGTLVPQFFAQDRQTPGSVAVRRRTVGGVEKLFPGSTSGVIAFYGLPLSATNPGTVPLYEYRSDSGEVRYSVTESLDGFTRGAALCRVWRNPQRVPMPASEYLR